MPNLDAEQKKIVRLIRAEGRNISDPKLRKVYLRAAVQTGIVESNLRNLDYGDADSKGWRQERASLYENPTNLRASIKRFREEFQQQYDPGERSYEVAAQVQRPREDLRGRYKDVRQEANQILGTVQGGTFNNAGPNERFETIPGVDNSQARQQALVSYLGERGKPGALLELKGSLDAYQDTPDQRVRINSPGRQRTNPGKNQPGEIHELFYNGDGGVNIDNGNRVQKGFVSGHTDHVHLAADRATMKRANRLAKRLGLNVGEYGKNIVSGHTDGSFHYQPYGAMDVSGDAKKMREFNRRVANGNF